MKTLENLKTLRSYVARCHFFLILCPALRHEKGHTVTLETWARRGWCRMEHMAQELGRDPVACL